MAFNGKMITYYTRHAYLIKFAEKLIKQNHINKNITICVKPNDHLNASISYSYANAHIYLTRKDLQILSKQDLKTLIAHEVGHVCNDVYLYRIMKIVEAIMSTALVVMIMMMGLIPYAVIIVLIVGSSILNMFFDILLIYLILGCIFVMMSIIDKHSQERSADNFCIQIMGVKRFVHMMTSFEEYDRYRIHKLWKITLSLWTCPLACLQCALTVILGQILNSVHLVHASFYRRIRIAKHFHHHRHPIWFRLL